MNNSEGVSLDETPLPFLVSPPKLKNLAAQEMALRYLAHSDMNIDDDTCSWGSVSTALFYVPALAKLVCNATQRLVVPSIRIWCIYHRKYVFYDRPIHPAWLKYIDEFALKPNGKISYLQTAINLLRSDKLDDVEKFRFACINCLVDDIRNLWPLVSDNSRAIEGDNPIIRYWIHAMKGDMWPGNDARSLESFIEQLQDMEWTTDEYFWNFSSEDVQIILAVRLLFTQPYIEPRTENLLLRLNERQLRSLVREMDRVYMFLCYYFDDPQLLLRIWNRIKFFLCPDKFCAIIRDLVCKFLCKTRCPLLYKMWLDTPIRLKQNVTRDVSRVEGMFQILHSKIYVEKEFIACDVDLKFFVALLTELSFQTRNTLWHKFWTCLVAGTRPCLEEIMRLCLNNEDEILQFKERQMLHFDRIKDFFMLLVSKGLISELDKFLNFCSPNRHLVASVKRQILDFVKTQRIFLHFSIEESFVQLDKFVDSAFHTDEDARIYKIDLMLSLEKLQDILANIHDRTKLGVSWT